VERVLGESVQRVAGPKRQSSKLKVWRSAAVQSTAINSPRSVSDLGKHFAAATPPATLINALSPTAVGAKGIDPNGPSIISLDDSRNGYGFRVKSLESDVPSLLTKSLCQRQ
jgi:hypothetical protein